MCCDDANGLPLAVVEAKRTSTDPDIGQQQAKLYARLFRATNRTTPCHFLYQWLQTRIWNDVQGGPPRLVHGFYTQAELKRLIRKT